MRQQGNQRGEEMATIKTHYDNLQVKRNASIEVIKAAYKGLTQRYHPDRNPDDRERCERVMKIINSAYVVLSDPAKRKEHDAWIADQEVAAKSQSAETSHSGAPPDHAGARDDGAQRKREPLSDEDALKRIWQKVYLQHPYLNSAGADKDDMSISALLELMRQHIDAGRTTISALQLASSMAGPRFDLIYEAEKRLGRIPLVDGFWNASKNKTNSEVEAELFAKYPFLNGASENADRVAIAAKKGVQDRYLKEGWPVGSACRRAGEEVGSRFSLLHQGQVRSADSSTRQADVLPPQSRSQWYFAPLLILGLSLLLLVSAIFNSLPEGTRAIAAIGCLISVLMLVSGFVNSRRGGSASASGPSPQQPSPAGAPASKPTSNSATDKANTSGKVSQPDNTFAQVSAVMLVGLFRLLSDSNSGVWHFLFISYAAAIYLAVAGVKKLRSGVKTGEERNSVAALLAMAIAIADTACAVFNWKTGYTMPSKWLFVLGAACWGAATYISARIAIGSIVGATTLFRLRQPLMWRAATLILAASFAVYAIATCVATQGSVDDQLRAHGVTSLELAIWVVSASVVVGPFLLLPAAIVVAVLAMFARGFNIEVKNRAAWSVVCTLLLGVILTTVDTDGFMRSPTPPASPADSATSAGHALRAPVPSTNPATTNVPSPADAKRLMNEVAAKWYRIYPFLDNQSPHANSTAIYAVIGRRNQLIEQGYDSSTALDTAISEIGPQFATKPASKR